MLFIVFRFIPSKAENNKYLACLVSHETYIKNNINTPKSIVVLLDVLYRPKIRIEIDEHESSLMEGGRLVLKCFVDAKPLESKIEWKWNSEEKRLSVLYKNVSIFFFNLKKINFIFYFFLASNN